MLSINFKRYKLIIRKIIPFWLLKLLTQMRGLTFSKVDGYEKFIDKINMKSGLEIGGPSILFKYALPIYRFAKK